tara:strand:- start:1066 stop:1257 length:192 start_codon:yes stop_codon:yes gene_type:complete
MVIYKLAKRGPNLNLPRSSSRRSSRRRRRRRRRRQQERQMHLWILAYVSYGMVYLALTSNSES